jgi:glycosyltransferase involved in cell wall biosynthesis
MSQPKVTVLIASYNGERFIRETVGSVLAQTFAGLELLVVDDGSTDGTREILRSIAGADTRMRVIEKDNEGLIATLNRGIAEARGTYIARLDHDDLSRPSRIERQTAFLDGNPDFVGVGCLIQNIDAGGRPIGQVRIRHERLVHDPAAFPPRQQWLYGPTPMVRADVLRRVGGYRRQFVAAEDRDLCWRLGEVGRLERLPEVLVEHRHHDANMSRRARRTQTYSALLSDLSAIARHFGRDDSSIVTAIEVGGDYGPPIDAYRALLAPVYPVEGYLLLFRMRQEMWTLPDEPSRFSLMRAAIRHAAAHPLDQRRLLVLRRAVLYLTRKPRIPGGS